MIKCLRTSEPRSLCIDSVTPMIAAGHGTGAWRTSCRAMTRHERRDFASGNTDLRPHSLSLSLRIKFCTSKKVVRNVPGRRRSTCNIKHGQEVRRNGHELLCPAHYLPAITSRCKARADIET